MSVKVQRSNAKKAAKSSGQGLVRGHLKGTLAEIQMNLKMVAVRLRFKVQVLLIFSFLNTLYIYL